MAIKKDFADEELAIFDEAVIYKRGEYWQFRMWLNKENKYAQKRKFFSKYTVNSF